jgi:hypothetical protein
VRIIWDVTEQGSLTCGSSLAIGAFYDKAQAHAVLSVRPPAASLLIGAVHRLDRRELSASEISPKGERSVPLWTRRVALRRDRSEGRSVIAAPYAADGADRSHPTAPLATCLTWLQAGRPKSTTNEPVSSARPQWRQSLVSGMVMPRAAR